MGDGVTGKAEQAALSSRSLPCVTLLGIPVSGQYQPVSSGLEREVGAGLMCSKRGLCLTCPIQFYFLVAWSLALIPTPLVKI